MAYSSLKRKTPLKAKSGFKSRLPQEKERMEQLPSQRTKTPEKPKERPKKAKQNKRSSLTVHLDIVFSLYIRLRDAMPGGLTRCISCGKVLPFEQMQCGHYFTRHNMSVRWDDNNCHSQCSICNCNKAGNIEGYTPNLIVKIGQEAFDTLNFRTHQERKWSGGELRDMIHHYTTEVKRLSKEKGIQVRI